MHGKQKCRILKDIRQKIADENDIPFVTRKCDFRGECKGTCPRCEDELRYLERQLEQRAALGRRVSVAALCAGLAFSAVACSSSGNDAFTLSGGNKPNTDIQELSGDVSYEPGAECSNSSTSEEAKDASETGMSSGNSQELTGADVLID